MQDKLISTLSPHNAVRRFAEKMARGQTPAHIGDLLRALVPGAYSNWQEQIVALGVMDELTLTPDERLRAVELLAPIVAECRSRPDHKGRVARWFTRSVLFSLMVTVGFAAVYLPGPPDDLQMRSPIEVLISIFVLGSFVIAPIVWPFSEVLEDIRFCRVRAAAVRSLGKLRFPPMAGLLALALSDSSGGSKRAGSFRVRQAAMEALPPCLDLLTAADYGRLDGQFVPQLCQALPYADEPVALALLAALEKVGDGRAVRPVEQIAARNPATARAEAARILPVLTARREQESAAKMLLRASSATDAAPDTLLRAVPSDPAADPQTLLRAGAAQRK